MTSVKISIVGAGSAVFSQGFIIDICLTESLSGSKISLMDVNQERLDIIHRLASRCAVELSVDLRFEKTTDMRKSLVNADFVINTAYVKGHGYAKSIREVAAEHGYYYYRNPYNIPEPGSLALTNFHQFNLMLDIAREMEKVCPDAYLLQASNPVLEGCTLIHRETDVKVLGICHGHYGYRDIATTIGLDPDTVDYEAPGLNHCIWLTRFSHEGRDAYPLIDGWIENEADEYWSTHSPSSVFDVQMSRAAVNQYRLYGLFPVGDTVRWGGWWYHVDIDVKKRWYGEPWGGPDTELSRPLHVASLVKRIMDIKRLLRENDMKIKEALFPGRRKEQHIPIIDAIVNNNEGRFQVNVPNRGALEGLPDDLVVEVPSIVDKKGVRPIHVRKLPRKLILEQILPRWLAVEHTLETYKSGDRSMLLWDVLQHHQTRSYEQAEALLEDLLSMSESSEAAQHYSA